MTKEEEVVDNYYQMNFSRFVYRGKKSEMTDEEKFWLENSNDVGEEK